MMAKNRFRIRKIVGLAMDRFFLGLRMLVGYHMPVIFMFHNIGQGHVVIITGETTPSHDPLVFETFISWLIKRASVISLTDLVKRIKAGDTSSKKPLTVLTFDDGCRNMYTIAYPILQQYACPATFFVPTAMIGSENGLTEQMLYEMSQNGMSIGSHTVSHPHLPMLKKEEIVYELRESKTRIEAITGIPCVEFAYPYGEYNLEIQELVQACGYICAVTAVRQARLEDPFALPRTYIPERISPTEFAIRLYNAQSWRQQFRMQVSNAGF